MQFTSRLIIVISIVFCSAFAKAQLGFCSGQAGDAIFNEDFGAGTTSGPPLSPSVTNYQFVNSGTDDGQYTISSNMQQLGAFWNAPDHTGDQNGKMLIVNASTSSGIFYQTPINGLCENTPYEFSAWIINAYNPNSNVCAGREIPIQVRFEIWDLTDTMILSSGSMAPRFGERSPVWIQYGLTFTTAPAQNGCILKLINQGVGGCGNDLAIDDIQFRTCGDATNINSSGSSSQTVCESDLPATITLNASTTTNVYQSPEFQWQRSTDSINYTDIVGATSSSYTTNALSQTTYFRLKIAEDAVNLNNDQCVNFSDVFELLVARVNPPVAAQTSYVSCDEQEVELIVSAATGVEVDWYAVATGGTPLATNTNSFITDQAGSYYAEARTSAGNCISATRTEIEVIAANSPVFELEELMICTGVPTTLTVDFSPATYEWSTGAQTQSIEISQPGTYECEVTTPQGCVSTAIFEVMGIEVPVIANLMVNGEVLFIETLTQNDRFEYSIDNLNFQDSPEFNVGNLLEATAYVRNRLGCDTAEESFFRIDFNLFFTPNGDGFNDRWTVDGLNNFPGSKIEIFDRYGKLLKQLNNPDVVGWDGKLNGVELPSSDYWYRLTYNDQVVTGHFTLKR